MIPSSDLADPAVRAFVDALNANDAAAVRAAMTDDATMTDDGTPRELDGWLRSEAFDTHGRMEVTRQSPDGLHLTADYTNDRWGTMATSWRFRVREGKVAHFDTGQA